MASLKDRTEKFFVHEEFNQYASCVCVPLVVIGIAIQIMSTTSGAVFSASIISSRPIYRVIKC